MKKRERYLSLIIVPHHRAKQWQKEFSYSSLKKIFFVMAVVVLLIASVLANYGKIFWRASQYEVMKKRTSEIEEKFSELQKLKESMSSLKKTESKLQHMLGISKQPAMLSINEINRSTAFNAASVGGAVSPAVADTLSAAAEKTTPTIMPVKGWISAGMSPNHSGVDIAAREGDPVLSAADGIVLFAGWDSYFGNKIEISHGTKFITMYGHNMKLFVKEKQIVSQGQMIALVGSTGHSSGPHLHYEIRTNGKPVDPTYYWINH